MHVFKRFYLISSTIFAFLIPLVTITQHVDLESVAAMPQVSGNVAETGTMAAVSQGDYSMVLWTIYLAGSLFFAIRFFKNLVKVLAKIGTNQLLESNGVLYVLLKEHTSPHTFMNYIFLNKEKYEALNIPNEVLLHEETHARQMHSLDILFVELCQIFMWFSPLIYLWKNMVRLNHEFLADARVLQKGVSLKTYQNILLDFTTGQSHLQFAHPISYYKFVKKRFTVMKTKHSKKETRLKALLLIPIVVALFYSFSNKEVAFNQQTLQEKASKELVDKYNKLATKYNKLNKEDIFILKHEIEEIKYIYNIMSKEQRKNAVSFPKFLENPPAPGTPDQPQQLENVPPPPGTPDQPQQIENVPSPPGAPDQPQQIENVPPPPGPSSLSPPPPPSVNFKTLAAHGAVFYLNGEEIEAKQALKYIENDQVVKIHVTDENTERPLVKLTTE